MQFAHTLEAVLAGRKTSTRRVAKPMEVQAGRRTRPVGDFETTAVAIVTNARGDTRVKWHVGQTLAVLLCQQRGLSPLQFDKLLTD